MAGDLELENIEEFLFDEDRVVSYKWLSKTLSLHVNQAKSKLEKFVEQWRDKSDNRPITVTFFVSGIQETTSGKELTQAAVVKEEDLENVKKSLKKVLSEHVYSVQKSTPKDASVLYQTDFDVIKKSISECNKYSAISCRAAAAVIRRDDSVPDEALHNGDDHVTASKKEPVQAEGTLTGKKPPKKAKGLHAFMKQDVKPNKATQVKDGSAGRAKASTSKHKKGSILQAFAAASQKNSNSRVAAVKKENGKKDSKEQESEEANSVSTATKMEEAEEKGLEKRKTKRAMPNATRKEKIADKRKVSESEESDSEKERTRHKGTKRRRVIQQMDSSSSEDESEEDAADEEMEEDRPIPPTPEVRKSESPSKEDAKGRRKVWKKKRYMDEYGCMVTEKVFDYESGEEVEKAEQPISARQPSASAAKLQTSADEKKTKKTSPPSGRKQTSLTSFFKKK